jgi:hypothetical protein
MTMTDDATVILPVSMTAKTAEQIDALCQKFSTAPPTRGELARWLIETALFQLATKADQIRTVRAEKSETNKGAL